MDITVDIGDYKLNVTIFSMLDILKQQNKVLLTSYIIKPT